MHRCEEQQRPSPSGVVRIELDEQGYSVVDEGLHTIIGDLCLRDALGRNMPRHNANKQSAVVWRNPNGCNIKVDEPVVPHAVFSWTQLASKGLLESEAKAGGCGVLVGHHRYMDTGKGHALDSKDGFVKMVLDKGTLILLGATVCEPEAASPLYELVQMLVSRKGDLHQILRSQIIHPILAEVVERALGGLHLP